VVWAIVFARAGHRVAAEVQATLPPEEWAAHVERRDRALMRLEQARRADPESFTGFTQTD
jgi:hypothetical protein